MNLQLDLFSTLPEILCLKQYHSSRRTYEVWSLQDICMGVRFGPYQETFIANNKDELKGAYQGKVKKIDEDILILNDIASNWLPYVNYAEHAEAANLLTFRTKSGIYYITCRLIPANTELLINDQVYDVEDIGDYLNSQERITSVFNEIPRIGAGERLSKCNSNVKTFITNKNLNAHQITYSSGKILQCNSYGNRFINTNISNVHESIRTSKNVHECNICGRKFTKRKYLVLHERIYNGKNHCKCNVCRKIFTARISYKRNESVQTGKNYLEDNACRTGKAVIESNVRGETFTTRSSFNVQRRIYTGEGLNECSTCGKRFTTKRNLVLHKRIHYDRERIECFCGKKFRSSSSFNKHEKVHSSKNFLECTFCGKKYATMLSLEEHERVHKGKKIDCYRCGKKFIKTSDFVKHTVSHHTDEKRSECYKNGKKFTNKWTLTVHERICTAK